MDTETTLSVADDGAVHMSFRDSDGNEWGYHFSSGYYLLEVEVPLVAAAGEFADAVKAHNALGGAS